MRSPKRLIAFLGLALLLSACEQEPSSQSQTENAATAEQTVQNLSGYVVDGVASKGPISGATINVYLMDSNGSKSGSALATTTTNSAGGWSVSLGSSAPNQALLIESSGGSYIDEADPSPTNKRTITLQANEILEGVLFPGFATAPITLLTDALLEKSRNEVGTISIQNVLTNNRKIATNALGFDPFTINPTNPVTPSRSASVDAIEYAMFLGGLATTLNSAAISLGKAVPDYNIMTGLIRDLSDGRLNGRDINGVITVQIGDNTRNFPTNLNLNSDIQRFRNNNYSAYSVTPVANTVASVNEQQLEQPGTNTTPVASDDVAVTSQGAPVTTNVLANDVDADGQALTVISFTQGTKGSVAQSSNGVLVYTPFAGQIGADSYSYRIGDGFGGQAVATVNVNILQVSTGPAENTPPIAVAGLGQTVTEFSTVNLNGIARDTEDGTNVTVLWTVSSGPSVTFSNANSPTSSFVAPDVSTPTNITLTLNVRDSEGLTASDSLTIAVLPVNVAPQVDAGATQNVAEQTLVNLTATASDSDGSIVAGLWQQISGPSVTISNASNINASFTAPTVTSFTVLVFSVTVTDDVGATAIDTVNIVVAPVNSLPTVNAGTDQVTDELLNVSLSGSAADSDGSIAAVQWSQLSGTAVSLVNPNTLNSGFTAPDVANTEILVFGLTVTDNEGGVSVDSINVQVNAINVAPTANAGADQTINELTAAALSGSASDTDGSIASVQWSQVGGPAVSLIDADTLSPTFTSPEVLVSNIGVLVFQLLVTDNSGAIATDYVTVIVNPVLIAPIANAGVDASANEQTIVQLDGSTSSDDRSIASYSWAQTGGSPAVVFSDSTLASPTVTLPDVNNDTAFTLTLTVTDDEGGSASDDVIITAISLNQPPLVVDDSGYSVDEETTLSISDLLANDSDPESDSFTLNSVTQGSGGTVSIVNGTTVSYVGNLNFSGADAFTYTVIDANGAISAPATVSLTVNNVNDVPIANDDSGQTVQGIPVTFTALTDNDSDVDGDTLSISGATQASNGEVVNNQNGTITYTPNISFNSSDDLSVTDSFTYTIVDGNGGLATATITVTVIPDSDGDSLTDAQEAILGTRPDLADTDGDGFYDQHEVLEAGGLSTLALDNSAFPVATAVNSTVGNNTISTDTTWKLEDSPFYVTSDLIINNNATLTIEAGVVVKLSNNVDIGVSASSQLITEGNIPEPQQVLFTSDADDSINGDTDAVIATAAANDWAGIDFNTNSTGTIKNTEVRFASNGFQVYSSNVQFERVYVADSYYNAFYLYNSTTGTNTITLDRIQVFDFDGNGQSLLNQGLYVEANSGHLVINGTRIQIEDTGNSSADHALTLYASYGNVTANLDQVSLTNSSGYAYYLDAYNGTLNANLSNISSDTSGRTGLDSRVRNTGAVNLNVDGSNSFDNVGAAYPGINILNIDPEFLTTSNTTVNNADYGLVLDATNGNFRNIALNNLNISGLLVRNGSSPAIFSNINLTNAPSPLTLTGQNITATIDAGLTYDNTVATKYIRVNGTFANDMTLGPDPLGSGDSVWFMSDDITINSGVTMTVPEGAVIKVESGKILNVNGNLVVTNNGGTRALFTSIKDDDDGLGGTLDTNGDGNATAPTPGDWNRIDVNTNATVNMDSAEIRYASYGIYQYNSAPSSFNLTNVDIDQCYYYGLYLYPSADLNYVLSGINISNISIGDGIYFYSSATNTVDLDWNNINIDGTGNDTGDHGLEMYVTSGSSITGTISNYTAANVAGSGIYLNHYFTATGLFDVVFSGITINSTVGSNAVQLIGTANTQLTIDGSVAANNLNAGTTGLVLQGVAGNYSNLNIANSTSTALLIGSNTNDSTIVTNPNSWDDATIVLTATPGPWNIRQGFPASIGVLGTTDLGYDTVNSSFTSNYMLLYGTLGNDTTLSADPLNTGDSVYHVTNDLVVPAGVTLTLTDAAVLKMANNVDIHVENGGTMSVTNAGGARALITSIKDDASDAGGDSNGDGTTTSPGQSDWGYIYVRSGSTFNIDGLNIRYPDYGFYESGETPLAFSVSNTSIDQAYYTGLYLYPYSSVSYTLNNVSVSNVRDDGIFIGNFNNGATNEGQTITLDFDNISLSDIGDNASSDRGLEIYLTNETLLTGRIDNISTDSTAGSGIVIQNDDTDNDLATGAFSLGLSGITVTNPGASRHGVQLIGEGYGNTSFTVDNLSGVNTIDGGIYGFLLQGVSGTYSHVTVSNQTGSGMYLSNVNTPTSWDATTMVMTNVPSPWHVLGTFPASIGTLGSNTANALGYNTALSTITGNYMRTGGSTLLDDLNLVADPLATGNSSWYVTGTLDVASDYTLTVNEDTVVKFALGTTLDINGGLSVTNGGGGPAYFTSIRDDSVAGETLVDATAAAKSDWNYINAGSGSVINIDNAVIRYADYGIYQNGETSTSFNLSNVTLTDHSNYGLFLTPYSPITYVLNNITVQRVNEDGIRVANWNAGGSNSGNTITLQFTDIFIDTIGNNGSNDRGFEIYMTNAWNLTGFVNGMTISNTAGSNAVLQNASSGTFDLTLSGLNFSAPGSSYYPLQLVGLGAGNTNPVINSDYAANVFDGGRSGITFQGVNGSASGFTTTNSSIASLYFSLGANPVISSATLDSAPGPIRLVDSDIPDTLNYAAGGSLLEALVFQGDLPDLMTLEADPLNTGNSFWLLYADATVLDGNTLTIPASSVIKVLNGAGADFFVNGTLNVTATAGNEAIFTSYLDDGADGLGDVLGDSNGDGTATTPANNNWNGIDFSSTAKGTIDNLMVKYAGEAVNVLNNDSNVDGGLTFNNYQSHYSNTGFYINSTSGLSDTTINGLLITEPYTYGLRLRSTTGNTLQPTISGSLMISGFADGTNIGINLANVDPNLSLSGFEIRNMQIGVNYESGSTGSFINSVISNMYNSGIKLSSTPVSAQIMGNVISNTDINMNATSGDGNSIYCASCSAYIYGNIFSSAYGYYGGAMDVNNGSPVIRNNLFVNNHGATCGTSLCLSNTNNAEVINNTFVNGVGRLTQSSDVSRSAAVSVSHGSGTVVFRNNVVYGNTDIAGNGLGVFKSTGAGILVESNNLIDSVSGFTADASDQIGVDPQFNNGFYSANAALLDAGSDLFSNLLTFGGITILSDGTVDTGTVDLGYHYAAAATAVSASNSTIVASDTVPGSSEAITLTVTVRDAGGNVLDAGQDVSFILDSSDSNATLDGSFGAHITDHADGSYSITYTTSATPSDNLPQTEDTLTAIINGVTLSTPVTINW